MIIVLYFLYSSCRALKRISSVKLKRTSLPAHPAQEKRNGELHEEMNKRSTSTIVPPLIEDLCIAPPQMRGSSSSVQLTKPNSISMDQLPGHKNKSIEKELEEHDNNDSGIIINIEDSEAADFVYPRMYTSTLNVVIK